MISLCAHRNFAGVKVTRASTTLRYKIVYEELLFELLFVSLREISFFLLECFIIGTIDFVLTIRCGFLLISKLIQMYGFFLFNSGFRLYEFNLI